MTDPSKTLRSEVVVAESTFTAPRPDCPFPERWHAIDAQSAELEVANLVAAMVIALQPDFAIETGTYVGSTAEAIGKALRTNGHGELVSVEVDTERAETARQRCRGLPVTVLQVASLDYTPNRWIDFAFFDSLPRLRSHEFTRFLPWMHDRTVVCFHDTAPHHSVRHSLLGLEQQGLLLSPLYLPTPRGIMFARVRPRRSPVT